MNKKNRNIIIVLGAVRDFHAMDWYHVLGECVGRHNTLFVTDSICSEGLSDMSKPGDNIEHLFIVDRFLGLSQSRIANIWRNIFKLIVVPVQVYLLRRISKKYPLAVFHSHPMYYLFLAWIARIKCGVTPQGSEILVRPERSVLYKFFLVKILRYASFVTVDSISMKNKIYELSGVSATVVQNGIDTAAILKKSTCETKRSNICSIRGLAPLYNIDKILQSRNMYDSNVGIDFVYPFQDEMYLDKVLSLTCEADHMIGRMSKKELYSFLGKCLLTISIPSSDSSPRSVYEAIFSGSFVAVQDNEYLSMLTPCMRKRVIVVDLENKKWLQEAIEFARQHAHLDYVPSKTAIERFDQYRTMTNALHTIYGI